MEIDHAQTDPGFESLRLHRAELLGSMRALEQALAAPAIGREGPWAERVHVALVELDADFGEHVVLTEGPDGFYRSVLASAPHLANSVSRLAAEHTQITESTRRLVGVAGAPVPAGDVDELRESVTALLAKVSRHRQKGADLVYEAYETDIGGET